MKCETDIFYVCNDINCILPEKIICGNLGVVNVNIHRHSNMCQLYVSIYMYRPNVQWNKMEFNGQYALTTFKPGLKGISI